MVVIPLIGLATTLLFVVMYVLTSAWPEGVNIDGKILDAKTRQGVPHAHVLVTLWPHGLKVGEKSFGVVTDENGVFRMNERIKMDIDMGVQIRASGKSGEVSHLYGEKEILNPHLRQKWVNESVDVELHPVETTDKQVPVGMRYETFCPQGVYPNSIEFIDSGWRLPRDPKGYDSWAAEPY